MSKTKKVISSPKETDLIIPGELVKIKVFYNSFSVCYQLEGSEDFIPQLVTHKRIYPIRYLVDFFRVNGASEKNYFVQRPERLLSRD